MCIHGMEFVMCPRWYLFKTPSPRGRVVAAWACRWVSLPGEQKKHWTAWGLTTVCLMAVIQVLVNGNFAWVSLFAYLLWSHHPTHPYFLNKKMVTKVMMIMMVEAVSVGRLFWWLFCIKFVHIIDVDLIFEEHAISGHAHKHISGAIFQKILVSHPPYNWVVRLVPFQRSDCTKVKFDHANLSIHHTYDFKSIFQINPC